MLMRVRSLWWAIWPNFSCEGHRKFDSGIPREIRMAEGGRPGPGYRATWERGERKKVGWFPIRQSNNLTSGRRAIISPQDQIKLREAFQRHLGWKPTDFNSHKIQMLLAFMSRCHTTGISNSTEIYFPRPCCWTLQLLLPPHCTATAAPLTEM